MSSEDSVSQWVGQLKAGDHAGAQPLWERYFQRLVGLARKKLRDLPRRAQDEEDVALSAFASFCKAAEEGRFPQLHDRDGLWRLLVEITAHKVYNTVRDQRRQKRGGGGVRGESALINPASASEAAEGFDQVIGAEPTPEFAAEAADECQRLLDRLGDPELRSIALWKMEGDTSEQIAAKLDSAVSTIERRLKLIRQIWERESSG
jgi:DNA-directed RNA polymerase specialized sigma24 family protein